MPAHGAKQPKGRFRPWPKKFDGLRFVYDKDKLRDEFLRNPQYEWGKFCEHAGYNPSPRHRNEFPIKLWQQMWLQQQVSQTEDSLMNEAVELRTFIARGRLQYPRQWSSTAEAMRQLSNHLLNRELANAQWDLDHAEEILANPNLVRCKITPANLAFLAGANKTIQEIQRHALLMPPPDQAYKATIPIRETDSDTLDAEQEEQRLKNIEPGLLGGGTLSEAKMTQILDKWIDQQAGDQKALPEPEALDDSDQPIDTL